MWGGGAEREEGGYARKQKQHTTKHNTAVKRGKAVHAGRDEAVRAGRDKAVRAGRDEAVLTPSSKRRRFAISAAVAVCITRREVCSRSRSAATSSGGDCVCV